MIDLNNYSCQVLKEANLLCYTPSRCLWDERTAVWPKFGVQWYVYNLYLDRTHLSAPNCIMEKGFCWFYFFDYSKSPLSILIDDNLTDLRLVKSNRPQPIILRWPFIKWLLQLIMHWLNPGRAIIFSRFPEKWKMAVLRIFFVCQRA